MKQEPAKTLVVLGVGLGRRFPIQIRQVMHRRVAAFSTASPGHRLICVHDSTSPRQIVAHRHNIKPYTQINRQLSSGLMMFKQIYCPYNAILDLEIRVVTVSW